MSSDGEEIRGPLGLSIIVFVLVFILSWQFTRWTEWTVRLQVENTGNLKWYLDTGDGFSEREGAYARVPAGEWASIRVLLPAGAPNALRLDPAETEGRVLLESVEWQEPWPGSRGALEVSEARWSGVSGMDGEGGNYWILEPVEGIPDIAGVWEEAAGHSSLWWWVVRLGMAMIVAVGIYGVGVYWNRRVVDVARPTGAECEVLS